MNLTKEAVYGSLWTVLIRYGFFFVNFAANLWLARVLAPEFFGVFALSFSLVELVFVLASFGLWLACVNLRDEPNVFDTCFILSVLLASVIFVISLGTAALASQHFDHQIIVFMVVISGFKSLVILSAAPMAAIEVAHQFKLSAIISGVGRSIGILLAVAMAHAGFETWSLLAREVLAMSFLFVLPILLSPYKIGIQFSRVTAVKVIRYSAGVFLQRMSDTLFLKLPVFLIGSLGGSVVVSFFDRSLYLSTVSNSALAQIYNKVGFVIFSKIKNDPSKIAYGVDWNIYFIVRLSFIVALIVGLFPELVMTTLLGSQWVSGIDIFRGFAAFIAFYPLVELIKAALLAQGITWLVTVPRFMAIAIACAAVVLGWQTGEWQVVSWAMSLGMVLTFIASSFGARLYGMALSVVSNTWLPTLLAMTLGAGILAFGIDETWLGLGICLSIWIVVNVSVDLRKLAIFYWMVRK